MQETKTTFPPSPSRQHSIPSSRGPAFAMPAAAFAVSRFHSSDVGGISTWRSGSCNRRPRPRRPRAACCLTSAAGAHWTASFPLRSGDSPTPEKSPYPLASYPPAGAVEAALRELGADCAADLAYAAIRGGASPPPGWKTALTALGRAGCRDEALDEVVDRLGLSRTLALDGARAFRVIAFLVDELSLPPGRLRRLILRRPALLETEESMRKAVAFLRRAGMTSKDIQSVSLRWPGLLTVNVSNAERVMAYLRGPDLRFVVGGMRRFLRRAPFVLLYDTESDMRPAVQWVRRQGLEVGHVVRSCPHVLGTGVAKLDAVVNFLRDDVGITDALELRGVVRAFPPILTSSIKHSLLPALRFLRVELGFERATVVRIVHAFPATLVLDVNNEMRQNVEYFRGLGVENVGRIVQRLPPILSYDLDAEIVPKMQYLERALGLSPYDVLSFPAYFSYSLRERIEPRTRFLQTLGRSVAESGLNLAITLTDDQFCHRVARVPLEDYHQFCEQLSAARASSSSIASREAGTGLMGKFSRKQKRRLYVADAKMPWHELF